MSLLEPKPSTSEAPHDRSDPAAQISSNDASRKTAAAPQNITLQDLTPARSDDTSATIIVSNVDPETTTEDFQFFLADDTSLGFSSIIEVKDRTSAEIGKDGLTFEVLLRGSSDVGRLIEYFNSPDAEFDGRILHAELLRRGSRVQETAIEPESFQKDVSIDDKQLTTDQQAGSIDNNTFQQLGSLPLAEPELPTMLEVTDTISPKSRAAADQNESGSSEPKQAIKSSLKATSPLYVPPAKRVIFKESSQKLPEGFTSAVSTCLSNRHGNHRALALKPDVQPFMPMALLKKKCPKTAEIASQKLASYLNTSAAPFKPSSDSIKQLPRPHSREGLAISIFKPGARCFIPAQSYTSAPKIRPYNPEAAPFEPKSDTSPTKDKPFKPFPSYFPVTLVDILHRAGMLSVEDARDTLEDLDSVFSFVKQLAVREPDVLFCFATEFSLASKLAKLLKIVPFERLHTFSTSEIDYSALTSVSIYCNAHCLEILQWAGITFVEELQELLTFPEAIPIFVEKLAKRRSDALSTFRATFDLSNRVHKMLGYEV